MPAANKHPIFPVRLEPIYRQMLDELAERYGLAKISVVRLALRDLHSREFSGKKLPEKRKEKSP